MISLMMNSSMPEQLRLHPRRAVGLGRARGAPRGRAWPAGMEAASMLGLAPAGWDSVEDSMCSTGLLVALFDAVDELVGHPLRAALGQRGDRRPRRCGSTGPRSWRPCRGRGRRSCPAATIPASRRDSSSRRSRARAACSTASPRPEDCGMTTMKRCGPSAASAFRRSVSSGLATVWLASTSVTSKGRPSAARSTTTCSTGSPVSSPSRSGRSRRSQPEDSDGSVETMISSIPCSATASLAALIGSSSPTSPAPDDAPRSRKNSSARSTRTCALSRTASS